jgi:hypothetical protein
MAFVMLFASTASTANADVRGISSNATTVDPGTATTVITIDADNTAGQDVRVLATTGDFTVCTDAAAAACTYTAGGVGGMADRDLTVAQATSNTDTLQLTWTAPATGPTVASFTAIQNNISKSVNVTVRGSASTVTVVALKGPSTSTTACQGTVVNVVQAVGATAGQANTQLCTKVVDSAGTRLGNSAVIYTTTAGTITPATDTTGATGQVADASILAAGSTGTPGTTATVTASAGGQSGTTTVAFGGDAASCTVTINPVTVQTGGSASIDVAVKDSTGGPVPDNVVVNTAQANPGSGANAQVLNGGPVTINGTAHDTLIAAIPGALAIGASVTATVPGTSCTGSAQATGTVVNPGGGGGGSTSGSFSGTVPADGSIGLLVTTGTNNAASLISALGTGGCNVESLAVLMSGQWLIYINGAPAVVNAAFPASLADTTPFFVRCNA